MMDLLPFDPADYLKSEVGFKAYLDDAALDGPEAVEDAKIVIARARARLPADDDKVPMRSGPRAASSRA